MPTASTLLTALPEIMPNRAEPGVSRSREVGGLVSTKTRPLLRPDRKSRKGSATSSRRGATRPG